MQELRLGIVGTGAQGSYHIRYLTKGQAYPVVLAAICDCDPERLSKAKMLAGDAACFESAEAMYDSGMIDGVLISTPHFSHPELAVKALKRGLHVMVEKPLGVYTKQAKELIAAAEKCPAVFGVMLNQRTNPLYIRVKQLVENGELGEVMRTNWTITDWFRSHYYYDEGGWRATWAGEGGGVLINQNPHTFDLWQWCCGMPKRVFAICNNGRYHDIEVEDDVTAIAEYENGATGVYVTTTGEAPGTNRLEIVGTRGKLVAENEKLIFWRLEEPINEFSKRSGDFFSKPPAWVCDIQLEGEYELHPGIMRNWAKAAINGEPLIAPGPDGLNSLQISNAIHLSGWLGKWVELPVSDDEFYTELEKRMASSSYKARTGGGA